jgi:hypothetical protein
VKSAKADHGVSYVLFNNGTLDEYRVGKGWSYLDNGVVSIGKGHGGAVNVLFSRGDSYEHDLSGWHYLTSNAKGAA